ncbi:MAG: hypothetical protein QXI12_04615 [Candidatus Methanomethyliaceae archaeon]
MVYAVCSIRKLSVELSLLISAIVTGLAGGLAGMFSPLELPRHLVEGTFTYLDIVLIFVTGATFMAILQAAGAIDYIVYYIVSSTGRWRPLTLVLLAILLLIPGALTGAGSISLLVMGAPVATALASLGISGERIAAILFILGGLSAAAPPVNVWAMITCAGTAIPYVGFELTLAIPVVALAIFTVLFLGWKKSATSFQLVNSLPRPTQNVRWWQIVLPFVTFFSLVISERLWPFSMPVFGLPLVFAVSAFVGWICFFKTIRIWSLSLGVVQRLLPLLATVVVVGVVQQILTATGIRGLIAYAILALPVIAIYAVLPAIIPFSEGVLTYGGAAVLGIPLAWFFDSIGQHATVVIAGLSLLWLLGDGLPPTALIGRLSMLTSGYKGRYAQMLRASLVPWILITVVALAMIIFSRKFAFLVAWST